MHTANGYLWLGEDLTHAGGGEDVHGETRTCDSQNVTRLLGGTRTEPILPPLSGFSHLYGGSRRLGPLRLPLPHLGAARGASTPPRTS